MDNYIPLKDNVNLLRDSETNAILNTNISEYQNYLNMKKIKEDENFRINKIESEINEVKNDLNEIKNLLRNLSNGSR